ncbi:3D-(3,5/4)-trihydroxycyclohexane-1,2-dione acylhydrolase (decyclizing) [Cryobacterium sp. PH31-L1]|uniref:3D-(3,5/4)-trihydroxycyclohexane-1,2-dione acylhydrolase (decyclizing) n=1 Tax=Cryobacterium sp. PH31-L1 TaxID=3046199 RepID=UPI0024BBB654|nr:3D-(3,5/4)-trihydroxycyclohexane-1,2-dione acylhydrolase (decyclizing) [Cryobacterium sp. PH31-L1]MDJ0378514.1 3D-(3,5/4)-trihydroxycyclohexane-1,2-dione acylhydrolase (decyclizing) [Cryobacterium sp. PH31-L1]
MTVSQALIEFLAHQFTVDGAVRERTIAGTFGIFGHGNVAGIGQALKQLSLEDPTLMPYHQARNEQGMVHESVAFARMRRRRSTFACTASVGPGATNMLTGAALATINRLPVLLLPSDTFATRVADPVLQQLELPNDASISVNDAFKPLSRFFDRVQRPEQLFSAAIGAMRVLTDPVETGAVTLCLPEDVQAQALDVPLEFLADREWHIRRPRPDRGVIDKVVRAIREAKRPLIVAGGGVIYSDAAAELAALVELTGIPVGTSQAGVGSLLWDHPQSLGAVGATGTTAANRIARNADLIIGIGTRYSDFTTGSRTTFQHPGVRFININVASFDAIKHGAAIAVVADAREALLELTEGLERYQVDAEFAERIRLEKAEWNAVVDAAIAPSGRPLPAQSEIIGAVQQASDPRDVVVCAAGSLPGDLHKLWRVRDELGYHVEYGFSCMGYEIAGGIGVRRAAPDRDSIVMVGDGSYLMMHTEIVSAVAEGLKFIIVLVQNHGYASIGHLSDTVGSQRYGTQYRFQDKAHNNFETDATLPIDLAANAASLGIAVIRVEPGVNVIADLAAAVATAKASSTATLIHINSDPLLFSPDTESWWDVPVAEVSDLESTTQARIDYVAQRENQRPYLGA